MTWTPTNNTRHIPIRWFSSRKHAVAVKKSRVPLPFMANFLRGAERPDPATIQEGRCEAIVPDES